MRIDACRPQTLVFGNVKNGPHANWLGGEGLAPDEFQSIDGCHLYNPSAKIRD
jgi:hypothetical protein